MPFLVIPVYACIVLLCLTFSLESESFSSRSNSLRKNRSLEQIDLLLLLRFLAASLVFVMHSRIVFSISSLEISKTHQWIFLSPAWLGMAIFFTLSGYLMGKIFQTEKYSLSPIGIQKYYRSRFLRIVPAAVFASIIILTFLYPQWFSNVRTVLRIFTFTFNGIDGPGGFGAFWSLTTEMQFYLIVPAVVVLTRALLPSDRSKIVFLPVVYLLGMTFRWFSVAHYGSGLKYWNPYIYTPLYENFDLFLGGFILASIDKESFSLRNYTKRMWPFSIVALYLLYSRVSWNAMVTSNSFYINL